MELLDALARDLPQRFPIAKLDRVGRTGFGAGGLHVLFEAVVAERALPRAPIVMKPVDHAERAVDHAIPTAVADVRLNIDGVELGANDRAGRATLQATGAHAVLAYIGVEQPGYVSGILRRERNRALDKAHMPPRGCPQRRRVVVRHAGEMKAVLRQL